jgi:nucleotidyltransferase substrate binding protein (TIGR01987 family)
MQDIRWIQRFQNYRKALKLLQEALRLDNPSELEVEGTIQRFEYTFELAWKTLKDYLEEQGHTGVTGSRDAIRLAFQIGIIGEGETWMGMIADRNQTAHLYDQDTATRIANNIDQLYIGCFLRLENFLNGRLDGR